MKRALLLLSLLAACRGDETISGYADPATVWRLTELDGAPFDARATLTFPAQGKVAGQAPCNTFTATQGVPLPWIEIRDIASTRMACPDLAQETRFLDALRAMTLAEVAGDVLILGTDEGHEMVFRAEPRAPR
ncbi:META domain-containing protein [Jannaschia rubra]|uniref:META domain-containing protein n=1 Tax=Jannaschia rubra TaxID=282197 RepID=UPI002493025A|nr:META domain-containing protein [Jannaschia rubra]